MVNIVVKDNIKEFTRNLSAIQKKQIPFATSKAINDVAIDAQNKIVEKITRTFSNRKKWWLKQQPTGIKVKFSKKTDLKASVFTKAYFAEIQEKGGTKTPKTSGNLAIPTNYVPKKYRTSHGAKDMINERQKVFKNSKGVFRRQGKNKVQLMWSLSRTAQVKPRFEFYKTAESAVKQSFRRHFEQRLKQALATAKV